MWAGLIGRRAGRKAGWALWVGSGRNGGANGRSGSDIDDARADNGERVRSSKLPCQSQSHTPRTPCSRKHCRDAAASPKHLFFLRRLPSTYPVCVLFTSVRVSARGSYKKPAEWTIPTGETTPATENARHGCGTHTTATADHLGLRPGNATSRASGSTLLSKAIPVIHPPLPSRSIGYIFRSRSATRPHETTPYSCPRARHGIEQFKG